MRARGTALVTIALLGGGAAPAVAATPDCRDGATMFVQGALRLFAVPYGSEGYDQWACVGGRGPRGAGFSFSNGGTGTASTAAWAYDGHRYLASLDLDDGEGGPDIDYGVTDLRTGRQVVSARGGLYPGGAIRVTSHGDLLHNEEDAVSFYPRGRPGKARFLSDTHRVSTDLALAGNVVYWTRLGSTASAAVARSVVLPGVAPGPEGYVFEPVEVARRADGCARGRGLVLAASPRVRVRMVGGVRVACRIGAPRAVRLDHRGGPRTTSRALRIAGDRWLLARERTAEGSFLRVVDTRAGRVVTRVAPLGPLHGATLLRRGTVAWIAPAGGVFARRPGARRSLRLSAPGERATALASSDDTVYWTAGGSPHRWWGGRR